MHEMEAEIAKTLEEVKENYTDLEKEWRLVQEEIKTNAESMEEMISEDCVIVRKADLAQLATEITQLKQTLPKVLNQNVVKAVGQAHSLEEENAKLRNTCESQRGQLEQLKCRCDDAIAEAQREKQESLQARCEMQSMNQQLTQQTEYCSSLGSACCTLLWRVSRCEESIHSILVGTKVDEFLSLVSSTLESYLQAYKEDWPQDGLEETQFILALCGIITNIAASAFGRDFLITNQYGRELIDTYIKVLSEAPQGKSARMKSLMLMSLYNICINQKGIRFVSTKQGMLGLAAWLIQETINVNLKISKFNVGLKTLLQQGLSEPEFYGETDTEVRLNALRLAQSLLLDEGNFGVMQELNEVLPESVLEELSKDQNKDIRELALEILSDIQQLQTQ